VNRPSVTWQAALGGPDIWAAAENGNPKAHSRSTYNSTQRTVPLRMTEPPFSIREKTPNIDET